jgi:hypothetical protein
MLAVRFLFAVFFLIASSTLAYRNEVIEIPNVGDAVKTPQPKFLKEELPTSWDYRSMGLLTADLNQHIPVYW